MRVSLDVTTVTPQPAGAGRYILELARHLGRREDVDFTLFARKADALRWEMLDGNAKVRAVAPQQRPLRLAWEQVRLPGMLRDVDVHHAPHYTMPERSKKPVVVTVHDMTLFDNPEWHERSKVLLFRRAISVAVERASAIVAVSQDTATRLQDRFPALKDVTVIPHGIDHERFHADAAPGEEMLLRDLQLPDRYIAFVGTLEPRKNLPDLIRAFDRIASKHPQLHLVLAGQRGWGLESFDEALARSPHRDRIVIPGYLPEHAIPPLLRHAKAVAYPSLAEGFGLPALEALACGAPLVSTTGSAIEEVVGGAATLVAPGDVQALAAGLESAIAGDGNRQAGIDLAARYTWAATAAAHVEVYKRVV